MTDAEDETTGKGEAMPRAGQSLEPGLGVWLGYSWGTLGVHWDTLRVQLSVYWGTLEFTGAQSTEELNPSTPIIQTK